MEFFPHSLRKNSTVLIADAEVAWRDLLCASVNKIPGLVVQTCVESKRETLSILSHSVPDLLVLALRLSDGNGLELYDTFRTSKLIVRSLIITIYDEDVYMVRALSGGSSGYLLKDTSIATVLATIKQATQGQNVWAKDQLQRIQQWQENVGRQWNALTKREQKIVVALVDYKSDAEIAKLFQISQKTVSNHITHILDKLSMENRREVSRWAIRHKLVDGKNE